MRLGVEPKPSQTPTRFGTYMIIIQVKNIAILQGTLLRGCGRACSKLGEPESDKFFNRL